MHTLRLPLSCRSWLSGSVYAYMKSVSGGTGPQSLYLAAQWDQLTQAQMGR